MQDVVRDTPCWSAETAPTLPSCISSAKPDDRVERRAQLVRHVGQELALQPARLPRRLHLQLRLLSRGDVADGRDRERGPVDFERTQADFDGELAPVLTQARQLEAHPHRSLARCPKVSATMAGVDGAEPLGDKQLDGIPQQLIPGVPEQPLRLGVHQCDAAVAVYDDHGIGHRLEHTPESRLERRGITRVLESGEVPFVHHLRFSSSASVGTRSSKIGRPRASSGV